MLWWMWLLLGLGLLVVEIIVPGGFFMVFFGLGAFVVAGLASAGFGGSVLAQGLTFVVVSLASLALFRKKLIERFKPAEHLERSLADVVGGVATASGDMAAGAIGKAEFRGTTWNVRNGGHAPIAKGQRCTVEKVEGLMLWIRGE
jgi:membrane protein implicated in regulation of membrane protease activity